MSISPTAELLRGRRRHILLASVALLILLLVIQPAARIDGWIDKALEGLGYAALIVGVLGRIWCTAYIGGREGTELVTAGPYSLTRNPLYVFSFFGVAGIGLISGMVTFTVLLLALFALYYRRVVRYEERALVSLFRDDYANYAARVPRWMPDFGLWSDAPELTVRPEFLRKAMYDAV